MRPAQQDRPDVAAERAEFQEWQPSVCARRFIFVDESGICQGMRLPYGYARRGERCTETAPFRTGKRTSLLGWMSTCGGEVVPFQGSVTKDVFERFVEQSLVPSLEAGDIVVWDNARIHSARAVELVEAAGAHVVPLPRYSPDLNPIEMMWSKVKHLIRKARADTAEALRAALEAAVESLSKENAAAWIEHCGYVTQPACV